MTWHIWLVLTILTWGSYNVFFKFAMNKIAAALLLSFAGLAHALTAFIWLTVVLLKNKTINYSIEGISLSIIMGILMTLGGITFFNTFEMEAPVSIALPAYNVGVVFLSAIVGVLIYGEAVTLRWSIGMLFGIVSFYLLTHK